MKLSIDVDEGDLLRARLAGHVTQKDVTRTEDDPFTALIGEEGFRRRVVLDLGDSDYLDSSGVSWLLATHQKFERQGGKLVLHTIPPLVQNMLKLLRLDQVLFLADTEQAAVKQIQGESA